jgi:hypothetical protein
VLPLFILQPDESASILSLTGDVALDQLYERMNTEGEGYETGIYAPGVFAFPITQQPEDQNLYVSVKRNLVTLFRAAQNNGITGLLAHNFLAGAFFYNLELGQEVWLVEGNEKSQVYQITGIEQFQKIERGADDVFIDLQTKESLSVSEVFDRFYTGEPRLVLQTCLEKDGDLNWGLTFFVGEPIANSDS